MQMTCVGVGTCVVAALLLVSPVANAGTCASPDLIETIPPDGAQTVPLDARLFARFGTAAEYIDEKVSFQHVGEPEQMLVGTWTATEGLLSITPPAPLVIGQEYIVKWPGLRGVNSANRGHGGDIRIRAGAADTKPPVFAGLGGIWWDVDRARDPCTDAVEDRYLFDIDLLAASDDGGRESLTILVFQTSGSASSTSAPTPVLVSAMPPPGARIRIVRSVDRGVGRVCYAAIARDLTGKVSSGSAESCTETVTPPFFYGCGTASTAAARSVDASGKPGSMPHTGGLLSIGVVLSVFALRRRGRGEPVRCCRAIDRADRSHA